MTGEIVNLRRARKQRARVEKAAKAAENRQLFGRSLAERRHAAATEKLEMKRLEGQRRDREPTKPSISRED